MRSTEGIHGWGGVTCSSRTASCTHVAAMHGYVDPVPLKVLGGHRLQLFSNGGQVRLT